MKNNIEVVLLGDSLIKRGEWKKLLEKEELINLGVDGDTISAVIKRINSVIDIKPKIVYLMIGINDLCISTPLETIFTDYKILLNSLKKSSIKTVVHALFFTQMPAVNKKVERFNTMLKEYCKKEEISFVDLNSFFINEKNLLREDLTTDGLHLGEKAYKVWAYKLKNLKF
jgi:lysophospholipase L1-like esterase